ncbi:tripartite motif-containing protein 46-like isoform X2 [Paramormyrops kingsleyae]|uniref:tripartite motif-containing protein 46-like isoform X2 n=1 Tax=Paramormyrops kingsleyae TaxID=1676925 RepID=UPI000CD604D3|nr:tripartite motif-containing protein 46-like isoform X2 [Paramormyrops kingsleyae]
MSSRVTAWHLSAPLSYFFFYLSVFLVFSPFLCLPVPPSLPLSPPVSRPLSRRPIEANTRALEQELQCPLCKGLVKQPILLPCHHSVCLHCASQLLIQNGYPAPDMSPEPNSPASTPNSRSPRLARRPMPKSDRVERVLRTGSGTYPGRRRKEPPPPMVLFPCPPCQRDVELGERGLADCLRNLALERIVERYRSAIHMCGVVVMCQFCKPPQTLEATKGCADCRANFCNECFKLYHPWGTPRAQHEHVPPTLTFRPKMLTCAEHDQERLHFYCKPCQRLLCSLCKLRRAHGGHRIVHVSHAYQSLRDKIAKGLNYVLANQETVHTQLSQLENAITQTELNSASAQEQLAQSMQELAGTLAGRRLELQQELDGARLKRGRALAAQLAIRWSLLENAGLLAFSQELLKEADPPCFLQAALPAHCRLMKAIESLQSFSVSADPFLRHFQLDITHELQLLTSLDFTGAPLAPVIDTQRTLAYDQLFLCWRLPPGSAPAWHYSVEFQRREPGLRGAGGRGRRAWQRLQEVTGTSAVIDKPEAGCVYALRVRGCNRAGFGDYSEEVYLHTPPAPVLGFQLDARWALHADHLQLSREQRSVRSVPGLSLLQAAGEALTSCPLTSDLLVGSVAVTEGRHYWACSVDPGSYLVKVGVGLEAKLQEWFQLPQDMASPRYDPDSGHDSGAEDSPDGPPPFCFLTVGMGKLFLPQACIGDSNSPSSLALPLPSRLGLCLDFEKGRVVYYDAHTLRPLWEGPVDCTGPVCPAFCFIGGGALQLQEMMANRITEPTTPRRVTIQSHTSSLNN